MISYILRFFIRKGEGKRIEYFQINLGYTEQIKDIKEYIKGWMFEKRIDLFLNILQVERSKEVGFLSNSYITMDLDNLRDTLEEKLGIKVGL